MWILLKQEIVSAVSSAEPDASLHLLQRGTHASTPPLRFYRPDALPAAQSTASNK